MVGRRGEGDRLRQDWEPWEARRASAPKGPMPEVKEARQDARLLLMVVRARFAEGTLPLEHIDRLAAVAEDERVNVRQRRVAASFLGRMRLAALARSEPTVSAQPPSATARQRASASPCAAGDLPR